MLVGKYIPNLIAKPFEVSRDYAQIIYDQTSSPKLDKVLHKWDEDSWGEPENRQNLAYIILVELLAYQFASPVRWIQTQDLLFTHFNFECLIEVGPSPMLTSMVGRTLKVKYENINEVFTLPPQSARSPRTVRAVQRVQVDCPQTMLGLFLAEHQAKFICPSPNLVQGQS